MRFVLPLVLVGAALFAGCGDNSSGNNAGGDAGGGDDAGMLPNGGPEDCTKPGDEDGNGQADCQDPACATDPACVIIAANCGNHTMDPGELCDDGNKVDGDGCDSNCTPTGCGNHVKTGTEQCDDGNLTDGDGCDSNCKPTGCGNGVITGMEVCDDGNLVDGDGCDSNCVPTGCGNGVKAGTEQCDDGNTTNGDGCDNNCTTTACGNGITTTGEVCDDGNDANWDACSNTCTQTVLSYVKASNTGAGDNAGFSVALSDDGSTLAVGAIGESSNGTGEANNSKAASGAVYIYVRSGTTWTQQAYLKASNPDANDNFGAAVALSSDGSTLAVGAFSEDSALATDPTNNAAADSGAAYVFTRSGTAWTQQAYIKASNPSAQDNFGAALALSGDGSVLAVGAVSEDGGSTGVGGDQANQTIANSGATYVFARTGTTWMQDAYVKASNTGASDNFGASVALSNDGKTLAVGAVGEASATVTDPADDTAAASGAAYVFTRGAAVWAQQAYIKGTGSVAGDHFGQSVSLSGNGATLAVGADRVTQPVTGANPALFAGAAYVFARNGAMWAQSAAIKANFPTNNAGLGHSVALSSDGVKLAIGAFHESSGAKGVGGDESSVAAGFSGAAFVFVHAGAAWAQQSYVKATNTDLADFFGNSVSLSANGAILACGAPFESSAATGLNGDQASNAAGGAGAAYIYQ